MRIERIGDATLYLGDAREIVPTLNGIDTVVTDPPYGISFRSNYRNARWPGLAGDADASLLGFAVTIEAAHSSYVFCRWDEMRLLPKPRSVVTWVKNNWSMGDLDHEHGRQTEVICFYPGPAHFFPRYRPSDVIEACRTTNDNHPTEKPHMLICAVLDWTDGCVLDPFMGSGSTGVACARLGRPFVGVEIDQRYFDVACRRIEQAGRQPDLFTAFPPADDPEEARMADLFADAEYAQLPPPSGR